jgi:hypothetical protein
MSIRRIIHALWPKPEAPNTPPYLDINVPSDVEQFGANHKIPEFSRATYRAGYVDGWLAAIRHKSKMEGTD